jgi:glycosyltransferase involved in cell wall biosynthesis
VTLRPPIRVAILSPGTGEFDSRAHRIARSLVARGDTVTIYTRQREDLAAEEQLDGYRVVRLRLTRGRGGSPGHDEPAHDRPNARYPRLRRGIRRRVRAARHRWHIWRDEDRVLARFREFPLKYRAWARGFETGVEPHDVWHGMWAASLPALERVRSRHGGRTVYDPRDVFLRSRIYASMPGWQRAVLTRIERHWAHQADAVLANNESYARMLRRDLGLTDVPILLNCPERWDPPDPRPDRIREALGIPAPTAIVLYQGGLLLDRGIEQSMDAILEIPDAALVLMGFGAEAERLRARAGQPPYAGRVHLLEPVRPAELPYWTASADVMLMAIQPSSENHAHTTPQKLFEAMGVGVPVVASDLPGMRAIVEETGCGVLCDPTDPQAIARAIRSLLDLGADGLRAVGDRGLAAAHGRYDWEHQFEVLVGVYDRILGR